MPFTLSEIVPWGRTFDEYRRMFALSEADLARRILGCGDGPASFNAEATGRGAAVVSIDPIYAFGADELSRRFGEVRDEVLRQTELNRQEFVWRQFQSVADLGAERGRAMAGFLADFETGRRAGRYVVGALPRLPCADDAHDLALVSHLLFLYSRQLDLAFHRRALEELLRVAAEVRVFPLQQLGATPSPHLEPLVAELGRAHRVEIVPVDYEFQRGSDRMLRIRRGRGEARRAVRPRPGVGETMIWMLGASRFLAFGGRKQVTGIDRSRRARHAEAMRDLIRSSVTAGVLAISAVALHATSLDAVVDQFDASIRNYNLISFGDASFASYGDTEGGLAVAGNLYLQGGALAARPSLFKPTGDPTLYVGGALTVNGYVDLQSGYASLSAADNAGWSWNAANDRLTNGGATLSTFNTADPLGDVDPRLNPGPSSWNFASLATTFASISQTLASATANGAVTYDGQTLQFAATAPAAHGVIVIDFDASLLVGNTYAGQMFSTVKFDVPSDSVYVINVRNAAGRTLFGANSVNFNTGSGYEHLLWNIVDTTAGVNENVYFGDHGEFYGAVLAPTFNVFADSISLNGQVVAGSYQHNQLGGQQRELHFTPFDYSYEVPEPSTYGLLGAAACAGLALWRRRRGGRPVSD